MLVGLAGLSLLALAGCASSVVDTTVRDDAGEITQGGDLGVLALQVGDCVNDPSLPASVDEADADAVLEVAQDDAVSCSEAHTGEVVLVDDDFFSGEAELPSEEVLTSRVYEARAAAVEEYTGEPFVDSRFDVAPIFPTAESREVVNDRGIACLGIVLSDKTWHPIESMGSIKVPVTSPSRA